MSKDDFDTFKLNPKGNVDISLSWAPTRIDFMSGKSQLLRRRIYAKKAYSFEVSGGRKDYDWLVSFYNKHKGQYAPFYFVYDGKKEMVYFGSALEVKVKREVGVIVGFTAKISLELDHRSNVKRISPSEDDKLPKATASVTHSVDWETKVYTTSSTERRWEYTSPRQKLSVKFRGLKSERDRLMILFESHEMTPCLFNYDGKYIKVRLPESVTFTDYREIKTIVGYSCDMDLEILD